MCASARLRKSLRLPCRLLCYGSRILHYFYLPEHAVGLRLISDHGALDRSSLPEILTSYGKRWEALEYVQKLNEYVVWLFSFA